MFFVIGYIKINQIIVRVSVKVTPYSIIGLVLRIIYLYVCQCINKDSMHYTCRASKYIAMSEKKWFKERVGRLGPWDSQFEEYELLLFKRSSEVARTEPNINNKIDSLIYNISTAF